jgi:hypothetical protein
MWREGVKSILEEALALTRGTRQKAYGSPTENWGLTASYWSLLLGVTVTPQQAVLMMVLAKIAREQYRPKRDNRRDGAGYFDVLDIIETAKKSK